MEIITHSFNEFDPALADFAKMMVEKRWIDATPSENRASGAYCTGFDIVREPRVFITYQGNMKNVITLAHELGHAYHSWVMRDLKWSETSYSSSLAETASIFAETLVRNTMLKNAKTNEEKKEILWLELESAGSFLVNIPARYDFECRAVELRKEKSITAPEFKKLTNEAWKNWYGDTLTEYNEMFWASKLHFSITHMGFYNYPYLFGYLFSLGIYAKKNEYGEGFKKLYTDILRDTGTMTAEDIIQKHFKEDISQKEFWDKSLKIVASSIEQFKAL
jgi:oligoendopeptidase F